MAGLTTGLMVCLKESYVEAISKTMVHLCNKIHLVSISTRQAECSNCIGMSKEQPDFKIGVIYYRTSHWDGHLLYCSAFSSVHFSGKVQWQLIIKETSITHCPGQIPEMVI